MSKLQVPDMLSYPELLSLDKLPEIKGKLVYVVKAYPLNGLAVMIARKSGNVMVKFADWDAKPLMPNAELPFSFFNKKGSDFVGLMYAAKIDQAIFYLTPDFRLVDMRSSLNKFVGPGMVRDLFGKIIDIQEVTKVTGLDDNTLEAIKAGTGSFEGDLIIKPSVFRTVTRGKKMYPSYAVVRRSK